MELFSVFGRILLQDDGVEDKLTSVSKKAEETEGIFSGVFKRISADALQFASTLSGAFTKVVNEATQCQQTLTQMNTTSKSMKDASTTSNTLGGQLKILKNELADFGSGIINSTVNPINNAINKFKSFTGTIKNIHKTFSETKDKSIKSISEFGSGCKEKYKDIKDSIDTFIHSSSKTAVFFRTLRNDSILSFELIRSGASEKIGNLAGTIKNKLSPVGNIVKDTFYKLPAGLQVAFDHMGGGFAKLPGLANKVTQSIKPIANKVASGLKGVVSLGLKMVGPSVLLGAALLGLGVVQQKFGPQIDVIAKQLINKGPDIIHNFIKGITQKIPDIMDKGTQLVQTLLNVIIANAPALIKGAAQLIASFVKGISQNIPKLIPLVVQLIQTIVIAIVNNLPTILMAGLKLLWALIQGICQAIPSLIAAIPQIVGAIWNALKSVNWGSLGFAILNGIIEGIKAAVKGIGSVIKSVAGDIMSGFKSIFGIHSPSTLMRDEIGKFIPAGIGEGIEQNTETALSSIDNMSKKMINGIGKNKNGIMNAAKGLSNMNLGVSLNTKNALKTNKLQNSEAENAAASNMNRNSNGGLTLMIENFYNNRKEDIKELAEELQFYYEQCSKGKGGVVNV